MAEQVDATFQEVFSETNSTDSIRLLCISTVTNPGMIPICYMSEALATALKQRVDAPAATNAPESEGSQAPDSISSPAHQTGTPPLPILPMSDIPLIGTSQLGRCSLVRSIVNPQHKKQDFSLNGMPND